jgi:hypothetical protein
VKDRLLDEEMTKSAIRCRFGKSTSERGGSGKCEPQESLSNASGWAVFKILSDIVRELERVGANTDLSTSTAS